MKRKRLCQRSERAGEHKEDHESIFINIMHGDPSDLLDALEAMISK